MIRTQVRIYLVHGIFISSEAGYPSRYTVGSSHASSGETSASVGYTDYVRVFDTSWRYLMAAVPLARYELAAFKREHGA